MGNPMISGQKWPCLGRRQKNRSISLNFIYQLVNRWNDSIAASNMVIEEKRASEDNGGGGPSFYPPAAHPSTLKKVLLLGEETEEQVVLQRWYHGLHCDVSRDVTVLKAVTRIATTAYELVIVDADTIKHPIAAIGTLRQQIDHNFTGTQVVVITNQSSEAISQFNVGGAHYCFPKPLTPEIAAELLVSTECLIRSPSQRTILLLEDNPFQQQVMRLLIESSGCEVVIVSRVAEAGAAIRQTRFSLIITDIELPDGTGDILIKMARHHQESLNIETPIIAMSANSEDFHDRCIEAGAQEVVSKPVSIGQVKKWVKTLC